MNRIHQPVTAFVAVALFVVFFSTESVAQESPPYTMFQTEYMQVLPGHQAQFLTAMTNHNKTYHSGGGSHHQYMYFVISGPRSDQYAAVMGPLTFTDMDKPSADGHGQDWANEVLPHALSHDRTYWVSDEDLSIVLDEASAPKPIQRVRFFDVSDNALFRKAQGQIKAVVVKMGAAHDRVLYRRREATRDGMEWALLTTYDSMSQMDENSGSSFRETFDSIYGAKAWEQWQKDLSDSIVSREDEFWGYMEGLSGTLPTQD